MHETDIVQVGRSLPRIGEVEPAEDFSIHVRWIDGGRPADKVCLVDLAPPIFTFKFYKPLREDDDLFRTVHVVHDGHAIAWGSDDEIDMAATTVEHLADEVMEKADFRKFLERNALSFDAAAAQLGISRRLVAYYASGQKRIPRYIRLACGYLDRELNPASLGAALVGTPAPGRRTAETLPSDNISKGCGT